MKMKIYCAYDIEAEECGPVMALKNDKVAIRQHYQSLEKAGLERRSFKLMRLCEFDTEAACITDYSSYEVLPKVSLVEEDEDE